MSFSGVTEWRDICLGVLESDKLSSSLIGREEILNCSDSLTLTCTKCDGSSLLDSMTTLEAYFSSLNLFIRKHKMFTKQPIITPKVRAIPALINIVFLMSAACSFLATEY